MFHEVTDRAQVEALRDTGVLYWKTPERQWCPCPLSPDYLAPLKLPNQFGELLEYSTSILRNRIQYAIYLEE